MAIYQCIIWSVGEAEDVHEHGWISDEERTPQDAVRVYLELHYANLEWPKKGKVFCAEYPNGEVKEYPFETEMCPRFCVGQACT